MKRKIEDFLGKRKADIIAAALNLADRHGIRGITTKKIAEEVGFVEAALYKHVDSKKELFSMILTFSEKFITDKFSDMEESGLRADEALGEWFGFALEALEQFPGIYRVLFSDELYNEDRDIFPKFKEIIIHLRDQFMAIIKKGVAEGVFRRDLNPRLIATMYLGLIQTAFTLWNVMEERRKGLLELSIPILNEFLSSIRK